MQDDHFAIITKTHHCVMDGVSIANLYTVLFDHAAVPAELDGDGPWQPLAAPAGSALVGRSLRATVRAAGELFAQAAASLTQPACALRAIRDTVAEIGAVASALRDPAPATPLNVEIGPHRRYVGVPGRLDDFKLVKRTFGGTVNDVVLAVTTGALRQFLLSRDIEVDGLAYFPRING